MLVNKKVVAPTAPTLRVDRLRVLRLAHAMGSGLGPSPGDTVAMIAVVVQLLREAGHGDHALAYALTEAADSVTPRKRRGRPRGESKRGAAAGLREIYDLAVAMGPINRRSLVRGMASVMAGAGLSAITAERRIRRALAKVSDK
jgi:hypothetical protein